MVRPTQARRRLALLACLGACAAAAGCGSDGIPGLVPVSGKIFFKGQPFTKEVARPGQGGAPTTANKAASKAASLKAKYYKQPRVAFGGVAFVPDAAKGNDSPHRSAGTIDADGSFQIYTNNQRGIQPGHYLVSVQSMYGMAPGVRKPPQSTLPLRYADVKTSGLAVEVRRRAAAGSYDLHLTP